MNALIVGTRKQTILERVPDTFLLIDDGELIDKINLPKRRTVVHFDPKIHSFSPLKDMNYRRARDFIRVLDAAFPEGENTLTRKNSNFVLLNALLSAPKKLEDMVRPSKTDPGQQDAYQKIQTLLLSPVLNAVLNNPPNMSFTARREGKRNGTPTILARLNRAELGDFDCFVLGNLLISQYQGHVIVPDFGFYATPSHSTLLRQNRLIAGINSLDEVPKLKQQLLLVDEKTGSHCTAEDAKVLALYAGLIPGTNEYNDFIYRCLR